LLSKLLFAFRKTSAFKCSVAKHGDGCGCFPPDKTRVQMARCCGYSKRIADKSCQRVVPCFIFLPPLSASIYLESQARSLPIFVHVAYVRRSVSSDVFTAGRIAYRREGFSSRLNALSAGKGGWECTARRGMLSTIALLWSPYVIGQTIIFSCCFFFFFFLLFFLA